jgi:hypothetical protein
MLLLSLYTYVQGIDNCCGTPCICIVLKPSQKMALTPYGQRPVVFRHTLDFLRLLFKVLQQTTLSFTHDALQNTDKSAL